MEDMAGFRVHPVEMDRTGAAVDPTQAEALRAAVTAQGAPRNLLVLIHGWNNDMAQARDLYRRLLTHLAALMDGDGPDDVAVAAILWPSKAFAEDELIPGNRDARTAGIGAGQATDAALAARLRELGADFDRADESRIAEAESLIEKLEDSPRARNDFVELLREMLPPRSDEEDDGGDLFWERSGDELFRKLEAPLRIVDARTRGAGGTTSLGDDQDDDDGSLDSRGAAVGLGSALRGMRGAAWRLMNLATYYQMKERAGHVGRGLNALLSELRAARPDLRIHLTGHSFGARAATAAVDGPQPIRPSSLVLLQGAFSHHGLSSAFDGTRDGVFAAVVAQGKVDGPIAITHSALDKAVGVAYAIASRLVRDNRSAFGGADDPFGGIGRNGAVKLRDDQVVTDRLRPAGEAFALAKGKVTNLRADLPINGGDPLIRGHSDVANPATAALVRAAIM